MNSTWYEGLMRKQKKKAGARALSQSTRSLPPVSPTRSLPPVSPNGAGRSSPSSPGATYSGGFGLGTSASEPNLRSPLSKQQRQDAFVARQFRHPAIDARKSVSQLQRQMIADSQAQEDTEFWGSMGVAGFRQYLIKKFGSSVAGFRVLDEDGNGRLSFYEFCNACRRMGFHGNLKTLWKELDADCGGFVSLMEIDPEVGRMVGKFKLHLLKTYGDILTAWKEGLDINGSGRIEESEVKECLERIGLDLDAKKLFAMLRCSPNGLGVTLKDFDPEAHNRWVSGDLGGILGKGGAQEVEDAIADGVDLGASLTGATKPPIVEGGARQWRAEIAAREKKELQKALHANYKLRAGLHTIDGFKLALVRRCGSLLGAWNEALDLDGNDRITFGEFCQALSRLGFHGNVKGLWAQLDHKKKGYLLFADLDAQADRDIKDLRQKFSKAYGNMLLAWIKCLDVGGSGCVNDTVFLQACLKVGIGEKEAQRLFPMMIHEAGRPYITLKDWDTKAHTALSRGDFRMISEQGTEEVKKKPTEMDFHERQESGFFHQIRRAWDAAKREEFAKACRMANAPERLIDTMEEFEDLCCRKFGTMMGAWRQCLDADGNGKLTFNEFCQACRFLGYGGDVRKLWSTYDADNSGQITLNEIDPEAHQMVLKFLEMLSERFGDLDKAWRVGFGKDPHDSIDVDELKSACDAIGYPHSAKKLFKNLQPLPGRQLITIWDLDPTCTRKRQRGEAMEISKPKVNPNAAHAANAERDPAAQARKRKEGFHAGPEDNAKRAAKELKEAEAKHRAEAEKAEASSKAVASDAGNVMIADVAALRERFQDCMGYSEESRKEVLLGEAGAEPTALGVGIHVCCAVLLYLGDLTPEERQRHDGGKGTPEFYSYIMGKAEDAMVDPAKFVERLAAKSAKDLAAELQARQALANQDIGGIGVDASANASTGAIAGAGTGASAGTAAGAGTEVGAGADAGTGAGAGAGADAAAASAGADAGTGAGAAASPGVCAGGGAGAGAGGVADGLASAAGADVAVSGADSGVVAGAGAAVDASASAADTAGATSAVRKLPATTGNQLAAEVIKAANEGEVELSVPKAPDFEAWLEGNNARVAEPAAPAIKALASWCRSFSEEHHQHHRAETVRRKFDLAAVHKEEADAELAAFTAAAAEVELTNASTTDGGATASQSISHTCRSTAHIGGSLFLGDSLVSVLRQAFRKKYANTVACWRAALDPHMTGKCTFGKFVIVLEDCAFHGNIKHLWQELVGDRGWVTLPDIDPDAARMLDSTRKKLIAQFGSILEAWKSGVDRSSLGRVDEDEFCSNAEACGLAKKDRAKAIFKMLRARHGQRSLTRADLEALLITVPPEDRMAAWAGDPDPHLRAEERLPSPKPLRTDPTMLSPKQHAESSREMFHGKDKVINSVEGFKKMLIVKYGSLFAAWRHGLDVDHNGVVTRADFANSCRHLGVKSVTHLWKMLDENDNGQISLFEIDPDLGRQFETLERLCIEGHGDTKTAWKKVFDKGNSRRCDREKFLKGCKELGYPEDAAELYRQVKPECGQPCLTYSDLWLNLNPNDFKQTSGHADGVSPLGKSCKSPKAGKSMTDSFADMSAGSGDLGAGSFDFGGSGAGFGDAGVASGGDFDLGGSGSGGGCCYGYRLDSATASGGGNPLDSTLDSGPGSGGANPLDDGPSPTGGGAPAANPLDA